jgi:hypothetical protein
MINSCHLSVMLHHSYFAYATALKDMNNFFGWPCHEFFMLSLPISFDCGPPTVSSYATLCSGTRMTAAHRRCGSPVDRHAPLCGMCWLYEAPSYSCWWSPPSTGCYWCSKTNSSICGFASLLMQYLLLAGLPGSILVCTYFLFKLILAADVHQSSRLNILHSSINLDVILNLENFLWHWVDVVLLFCRWELSSTW